MTNHYSEEYLEDVLVRFAYHSTGIEGNTLTLRDTQRILEAHVLPSSENHSLRELYEVDNHRRAFDFLLTAAVEQQPFNSTLVRHLHYLLMDRIRVDAGEYKTAGNRIQGASFRTAEPFEVPFKIQEWCDNLNWRLDHAKTFDERLEALLDSHIKFEQIHPFSDGNGRTGRMLINYGLILDHQPLLVIERKDREHYIDLEAREDVNGLMAYAKEKIAVERQDMENFYVVAERQAKFEQAQWRKIRQQGLENN
ncbi:Fic family protein [Lacticaseibacillus paracasei]|uniref:Fic family protein n=1 Tax=Lacticaseibacillus paracasei TaxID=1597 RepID=UPI000F43940C|nr:Fic family protein [Lacticaseibacillus paracasei]RND41242.1 mobile mystery protein B [Lacticaseibacillus paracasei]